jgi:hypothetical protein
MRLANPKAFVAQPLSACRIQMGIGKSTRIERWPCSKPANLPTSLWAFSAPAFNFVHFIDALDAEGLRLSLPLRSWALETGGYKGRSRTMPKSELHALISGFLGLSSDRVVTEYGMCELSSQAYDTSLLRHGSDRIFRFPPWARTAVVSPETGREVQDGEIGLLRVYDLANVYSVMAVETQDLARRRGSDFDLIGRTEQG